MTSALAVISDLKADRDQLDRLLSTIDPAEWSTPTPAPGWTIAHQIAHLTATFRMAGLAAADPAVFQKIAATAGVNFDAAVDAAMAPYLDLPPDQLLPRWKAEITDACDALAAVPLGKVVPWLVNPLPPAVLASAGMMELFAHGQDVADALGTRIVRTDRVRHIVAFAVRTWEFGYVARGLTPPQTEFRFELTSPSGTEWAFGPEDAENRISGSAVDFCLLVCRRRHHEDLTVKAVGELATHWLTIAQAYRGPAGQGREPGQFAAAGNR